MNLVSENIGYADFREGSPGQERQMAVGSLTTSIFGDFGGYFFGNVTAKTISIHEDMLPLVGLKFVVK